MSKFKLKVKIHRPDRIIAPNFKVEQLDGKSLNEIIDIFENRIKAFYLEPIDLLIKNDNSDFGFTVIALCFTILDLLSLYFKPVKKSNESNFEYFIEHYLPIPT